MGKSKKCCYYRRIPCQYSFSWEGEYLNSVLPNQMYWVGLYQDVNDPDYSEPAGGWKWLDGKKEEKLGSNIWVNNEPNDTVILLQRVIFIFRPMM